MERRLTVVVLLALAVVGLSAPATAQQQSPDFRKLIVKANGRSVQATVGYHCVPGQDGSGGGCTEASYPLTTTGTVTLRKRATVELLLGAPAEYVTWRTARVDGQGKEVLTHYGEAKRATKTGKRWRLTLPKTLRRSTKLFGVNVRYKNAFADFEVGARVK